MAKKRLFLIEWEHKDFGLIDSIVKLKEQCEIVYWTAVNVDKEVDQSQFPGTIFQDQRETLFAKPAKGADISGFEPMSEELIKKFSETEATVLTMMNKKYERFLIEERKRIYYDILEYWYNVIKKYKPDAIVFSNVPHTVYDFVIYSLAKYLNIKTIMFDFVWVGDRYWLINDYKKENAEMERELEKNKNKNFSMSDLSEDIRKHYERHLNPAVDATPWYHKEFKKNFKGFNFLKIKSKMVWESVADLSIFEKALKHISGKFKDNMRKEYSRVQTKPDLNRKFVYLPLSYQPEASTCPLGEIYVDQILMIKTVAAALPDGWVIYVKEHPIQWMPRGQKFFSYRYKGFYERIAEIKNVFVIPADMNSYELIEKSQAIATVISTVAWDGTLKLKQSLIFGYPWFIKAPGIFKVDGVESCKQAFGKITGGFRIKQQDVINYLACLDKASSHGYMDEPFRIVSSVSKEENGKRFYEALISEINKK
ncbi:MAG: hypothetical protein PHP03_03080 [Candidatus Pacebacteria bacterium]|nr:hypothetical protein [Candidatus Paceibacterota bacterium]